MISNTTADLTPAAHQILEVASRLFYDHGIHAVGVDTIAAESGVTKRTLYNRFGSKDALVAAYLQDRHDTWWGELQRRLATASAPRVLTLFDVYLDSAMVDRGCAFLNGASELPEDHDGFAVIAADKQAVRALVSELLAEDRPDLDDPESVAEHVFLLLEGAIALRGIDGDDHRLVGARRLAAALLERSRPAV